MSSRRPTLLAVDIADVVDGVHVIALVGEMDFTSADSVLPVVNKLLSNAPAGAVFDLSRLSFLDSTGVRKIVEAVGTIRAQGGSAAVACPTAPVKRVFEILHLDEVVPVEETVQGAIELVVASIVDGSAQWLDR